MAFIFTAEKEYTFFLYIRERHRDFCRKEIDISGTFLKWRTFEDKTNMTIKIIVISS